MEAGHLLVRQTVKGKWLPLALAVIAAASVSPAVCVSGRQSREDALVHDFMSRHHVPGLAFVIMQNGELVSHGEYGVANEKTGQKITTASVFPIASLSKPFVALGILALAEQGAIRLEDPISKYVHNLPDAWKTIQVIRLLDHTAGVPDHYNSGKWNVFDQSPVPSDELLQKLTSLPLEFVPGERFKYSNGNYVLLAKAIERVTGETYGQFLSEKIFKPLNMQSTKVLTLADLPNTVTGYRVVNGSSEPVVWNPDWAFGHGAIGATSYDLARLDIGLYTEKIVKFSTLKFVTTPQPLNDGSIPHYAMGWTVSKSRGASVVEHDGRLIGARSHFARFPKFGLTVIVLSNSGDASLANLGTDLAGTVVPELAWQPIADENADLTRLDLAFVKNVKDASVDEAQLSPGVQKDYETKSHWSSLASMFTKDGEVTLFAPISRGVPRANEVRTSYRLEQGDTVRRVAIGRDADGHVVYFVISS